MSVWFRREWTLEEESPAIEYVFGIECLLYRAHRRKVVGGLSPDTNVKFHFRWTAGDDGGSVARKLGAKCGDGADVFHCGRGMHAKGYKSEQHGGRGAAPNSDEEKLVVESDPFGGGAGQRDCRLRQMS